MFLGLSHEKTGTIISAEQYGSILTSASPKLGQLEKAVQKNREPQASNGKTLQYSQQSLLGKGTGKYIGKGYETEG